MEYHMMMQAQDRLSGLAYLYFRGRSTFLMLDAGRSSSLCGLRGFSYCRDGIWWSSFYYGECCLLIGLLSSIS